MLGNGCPLELKALVAIPIEGERAARVLVGSGIAILALEIRAESHRVIVLYPAIGFAFLEVLHRRIGRNRVGEAGKVGETERGRPVVDRLLRRSLDAEVGCDVVPYEK